MPPNINPNIIPNSNPNMVPQTGADKPHVESGESLPTVELPRPRQDASPSDPSAAPVFDPASLPTPPAVVPGQQVSSQPAPAGAAAGAAPAMANEVDVLEKEWVDKADDIIEKTKGDPYTEEESIEALQIDYLKKRYGHDVKKPDMAP